MFQGLYRVSQSGTEHGPKPVVRDSAGPDHHVPSHLRGPASSGHGLLRHRDPESQAPAAGIAISDVAPHMNAIGKVVKCGQAVVLPYSLLDAEVTALCDSPIQRLVVRDCGR